jgi:nicotinate-nucleotide--dimethylbenzimidazole phosphoribosyltransferase
VITEAIEKYDLFNSDALNVLMTVGGLDIAGLAGVCIGGAIYHVPVVLDGVISMVAALVAERILPGTKAYLIPSHKGKEPAMELLARELLMEPVIDGKLALGEGTGAVMMLSLLDIALSIYSNRTTFSDIQIEQYQRLMI